MNNKIVVLDGLPKTKRNTIDWSKSIGFKFDFIYNDIKGSMLILEYNPKGQRLLVEYKDNKFSIITSNLIKCKIGRIIGSINDEFIFSPGYKFEDNKRNITIISKELKIKNKKGKKWYKYVCNNCGHTDWILENNLKQGKGCSCCAGQKAVLGINTIWDKARWMVDLGVSEEDAKQYTKSSGQKISVKCPDCGRQKTITISTIYQTKSIGCTCGDGFSYPEKFFSEVLRQLGISYKTQLGRTTFEWCENYRYDFYFEYEGKKCILETHGKQHYESVGFRKTMEDTQFNDYLKEKLAIDNGIDVYIEINCINSNKESLKRNSLSNIKMIKLFGIERIKNIDWNKCDEFATCNIAKTFYNEWLKVKGCSTIKSLANKFGIHSSTASRYIKMVESWNSMEV